MTDQLAPDVARDERPECHQCGREVPETFLTDEHLYGGGADIFCDRNCRDNHAEGASERAYHAYHAGDHLVHKALDEQYNREAGR